MKKLLKEYVLNSDMDYFEMIVESLLNGQRNQSRNQFQAMPKANRISFLQSMTGGNWEHGLPDRDIAWFIGLM